MDIKLLNQVEKQSIGERQPLPERYLRLSDDEMDARIAAAKRDARRARCVILGHHYQRDEVIKFADYIGDSLKLVARGGEPRHTAEFIVFCGVHFMAESADILRAPHQKVVLPDLAAGCSMADMAARRSARDLLARAGARWASTPSERRAPDRPGHLHQLVSGHQSVRRRARRHRLHLHQRRERHEVGLGARREAADAARSASRPQHRLQDGRAARRDGGVGSATRSWGGLDAGAGAAREADSVEGPLLGPHALHRRSRSRRSASSTRRARSIAHPECTLDVVQAADESGSTEYIINAVKASPAGTVWAVATEVHLVNRLADAGRAGPDGRHARSVRLPVLDDVPRLAEPPALDSRRAARRPGPQPDHRPR